MEATSSVWIKTTFQADVEVAADSVVGIDAEVNVN